MSSRSLYWYEYNEENHKCVQFFVLVKNTVPDLPKNTAPIPCSSNNDPLAWHVFRFGKKLSKYKRWIIGLKCHQHFYVNDRSIWLKRVMLSSICILAECGNSCFNVLATAENIEYLLFGELWKNLFECFKSRTVICCSSVWTRRWTTKKRSGYITCCERIRKASCNIRTRFNRNRVSIWCFNSSGYLDRAAVSVLGYFCLCWFTWVFRILLTVFLVISIIRNWVSKTFEIMIIVIWWRTKIKCYPVVWCNQFSSVFL